MILTELRFYSIDDPDQATFCLGHRLVLMTPSISDSMGKTYAHFT